MNLKELFATVVAFVITLCVSTSISLALSSAASAGNPKFGDLPREHQATLTVVVQQVAETPASREAAPEARDAQTTRENTCRWITTLSHKGHIFEKRRVC